MPNYLFILLSCFVIYGNTLCNASNGTIPIPKKGVNSSTECQRVVHGRCVATYDNSYLIQNDSIRFGGSRVSEKGTFKLGFFVRGGNNTYLGIWYNTNPEARQIVWVANRDTPISPQQKRNCSLVVAPDGITKLLVDPNNHPLWSSNSQTPSGRVTVVLQLLDNGNLVLTDRSNRKTLWQSFENPTDTILQDQWRYFDTSVNLTSWKSSDDPAQGSYSFQRPPNSTDYDLSITRSNSPSIPYWMGSLSNLPPILTSFLEGTTNANKTSLRLHLNPEGAIQLLHLDAGGENSTIIWTAPTDQCDVYEKKCGSFQVCDAANSFRCKCLPGFNAPTSGESTDCTRRSSTCSVNDEFLRLPVVNTPPHSVPSPLPTDEICKHNCLVDDCECKAYSYDPVHLNCLIWTESLTDIQEEFDHPSNATLYVRVAPSDIDYGKISCSICGANVIPYPLSTNSTCGDPNYFNFQCNSSNGQVYFSPTRFKGKSYKVSRINETGMKFVVQLPSGGASICDTSSNIESKLFGLNNSSPFSIANCSVVHLIGRPVVEEVLVSWKLPPPPPCITQSDCTYWPNTTCYQDVKACKCSKGFHSDLQFLNCTPDHKGISLWVKVGVASTCGILALLLGTIFVILRLRRRSANQTLGITEIKTDNDIEDIDIPFVDYESILNATDNFSEENKLGVGGFGPVYKGKLADGNAVAIKRLSAASAQGVEEFRNEVILIAKLQHRNLVRVLGYCIKGNEKILIYEFMPNKSLDAFIFDRNISPQLDWAKRFNIIMGITRGLLYLHQDSRLIIIHRDLKPSNILLDDELNPKISDFGLARIIAGNQMATSTARVIGTHGYMSPEYALDGYFSIKSDVYSFGMLVLETISGKRCAGLLQFENNLISLLGYAWSLWIKESPMELVDESVESYDASQVRRCINVGLLCVQEDPSDRPTMSTVVLMLSGDNMNLPYPKQPVFVVRRPPLEIAYSSSMVGTSDSNVELTTTIKGR